MECNVKVPTLYAIQLRCIGLLGRKMNITKIYSNLYAKLESLLSESIYNYNNINRNGYCYSCCMFCLW